MDKHRIVIVGAGFWGREWLQAVAQTDGLGVAAVVARTRTTLEEVASQFGLGEEQLFDRYDAAFARADADIVAVVTPSDTHLPIVEAALEAGKHVICEKPLAHTWEAGLHIARLVQAHPDLKFMVAQTRRFVPQVETLRRFISSGRLGRVSFITFDHRVYDTDGGWRTELFSPVLEDMSTHHFDAFRYITGQEPVSVYAEGWNPPWSQYSGTGCHNVLLTLTGDVHVNYFATWTTQGEQNSYDGVLKIVGEGGSLDLVDADTLLFYPAGEREAETSPEPERIPMVEVAHREVAGVARAFLEALDQGGEPPCSVADNLPTLAMACAALESCRTDCRVDVTAMLGEAD